MKYECHITILEVMENLNTVSAIVRDVCRLGWSHSCIAGDPQLGEGTRHYATHYFADKAEAILETLETVKKLEGMSHSVVRYKVEEVIFDSRRG